MKNRIFACVSLLLVVLLCFSGSVCAELAPPQYYSNGIYYYTYGYGYAWLDGFSTKKATATIPKSIDGYNILDLTELLETSDTTTHVKVDEDNLIFEDVDGNIYDESRTVLLRVLKGRKGHVVIPEGVEEIGEGAFSWCQEITKVTLPKSLKRIESNAFSWCTSLKKITIPKNVEYIGHYCFFSCSSLSSIQFENKDFELHSDMINDTPYLKKIRVWEDNAQYMGDHMLFTNKEFPENLYIKEGTRVLESGSISYDYKSRLKSVYIPDSVEVIESGVFKGCTNLTEIRMPERGVDIAEDAFTDCGYYNNLHNWKNGQLYIGKHLISAGESGLIREGTLSIANGALKQGKVYENLQIPKSVTFIADDIKGYKTRIKSITLEKGNKAFQLVDNVLYRKADSTLLLASNQITKLNVLPGTKTIASNAMAYCKKLKRVTLPDTLEEIGFYAFVDCVKLTALTIPKSLHRVDRNAFYGCSAIHTVKAANGVVRFEQILSTGIYRPFTVDLPYSVKSIDRGYIDEQTTLLVASNSFALEFAKAYNIPYKINKEGPKKQPERPAPNPSETVVSKPVTSKPASSKPIATKPIDSKPIASQPSSPESQPTVDVQNDTVPQTVTDVVLQTPSDVGSVGKDGIANAAAPEPAQSGPAAWPVVVGVLAVLAVGTAVCLLIFKKKK